MKRRKQTNKETPKIQPLEARTDNQRDYIRAVAENEVVLCSGPAGSGKSFIAAGLSAQHLHHDNIEQIIITRPLVCAGKEIGSLPGEVSDKISPYLAPMEKNFQFFFGRGFYGHYFNDGKIQYKPLELMRGHTFDYSYMILDEAQNCTLEQIKMFITRIGEGSKVLINGDVRQSDIGNRSGLQRSMDMLREVEGVGVVGLTHSDIQRNGIIGRVLRAMEE